MPQLLQIDELSRADHWHLAPDDECFFVGEYIKGAGWQAGQTNDLISNLKKSPELQGTSQWHYKGWAIQKAANDFRTAINLNALAGVTVVPMPPSKSPADPLYDDRMTQVVRLLCQGTGGNPLELLYQAASRQAFHQSDLKRDVALLVQHFLVNENLADPHPETIIVVDDVLTTGAHFRAAKTVLQRRFGNIQVVGLFIARRVFPQQPDHDDAYAEAMAEAMFNERRGK